MKQKLFVVMTKRNIALLISAIVLTLLLIAGLIVAFIVTLFQDIDMDSATMTDRRSEEIHYNNGAGTLELDFALEDNQWVEIIKENRVVQSYGNKLDDKEHYTQGELSYVANNFDQTLNKDGIRYDYILFQGEDGDNYLALVKNKLSGVTVNSGLMMPKGLLSDDGYGKLRTRIMWVVAIYFALLMGVMLTFARSLARRVTDPINILKEGLNRVRVGTFDEKLSFKSDNELGELRDAFNYMIEKLDVVEKEKNQLNESKRQMILDISHDLRTPMTSILGYSEALAKGVVEEDGDKEKYLEYIYSKSKVMSQIIEELFEYSKLESESIPLNFEETNLSEWLRQTISELYDEFEKNDIQLEIQIPNEPIIRSIDKGTLSRAITNILINAIRYNTAGTTVTCRLHEQSDGITMEFEDDGVGIEKEHQDKIFDHLYRIDAARALKDGTGLGLSIAKKIVELHEGTLTLESDSGKGSLFKIRL